MAKTKYPQQDPEQEGRQGKVDLVRAIKLAFVLFGVIALAAVLTVLLTDGLPDLPFDYEGKGLD